MSWKKIGKVGVDSGTLMITDPAYQKELPSYNKLVGLKGSGKNLKFDKKDSRIIRNKKGYTVGISFNSGLGDGEYPVYADIGNVKGFGRRVKQVLVKLI